MCDYHSLTLRSKLWVEPTWMTSERIMNIIFLQLLFSFCGAAFTSRYVLLYHISFERLPCFSGMNEILARKSYNLVIFDEPSFECQLMLEFSFGQDFCFQTFFSSIFLSQVHLFPLERSRASLMRQQ